MYGVGCRVYRENNVAVALATMAFLATAHPLPFGAFPDRIWSLGFSLSEWGGVQNLATAELLLPTFERREFRCRVKLAHVRKSRPLSGLGFQVKLLKPFREAPFSLGSGLHV